MCIFSSCGQIVFGCVMVLCLILTAVATFDGNLLRWECINDERNCDYWMRSHLGQLRTVAVFMCLAIVLEIIALLWNFITFCTCCWKRYIIHPLIGMAFLVTASLLVAVIVYTVAHEDNVGQLPFQHREYEHSFWLAVSALILAAIDTLVGGLTVCLGERGL